MVLVDEVLGERLDRGIQREHLLDQAGQVVELRHQRLFLASLEARAPCQRTRQQPEGCELCREGLGRRDADFRARVCQE